MNNRIRNALKAGLPCPPKARRAAERAPAVTEMPFLLSPGTILAKNPVALRLGMEHLTRHICIAGGSGKGKSKLLEKKLRQLASQRGPDGRLKAGGMLIDPHGDTADETVRYLAGIGFPPEDVIYLKPGVEGCFAFDPAADAPVGVLPELYEQWLAATVDRVVKAVLRNVSQAEEELMNRLKRWMQNVFTACLVATDAQNTHVGLDKALIFTDPNRPEFPELYAKVKDHLPAEVRSDFEKLIATPKARDQEAWMESTINRLRGVLKPVVRWMLGQHAKSLDPRQVIQERKLVLVNLAESDFLSREQANMIGGLLVSTVVATARRTPEGQRRQFFLVIDEAENFIGEDLRMGFAELRKFGLSLVISFQELSCLRKGELDLVGKVVANCGLQMTCQQQNPDDIEYLAKAYGYGSLDFTPLLATSVRPDGYDWVATRSVSVGLTATKSQSSSVSTTRTHSETRQEHTAQSISAGVTRALAESVSEGETDSVAHGVTAGKGGGASTAVTASKGGSRTESETRSEGSSSSDGGSSQVARGENWSDATAISKTVSSSATNAVTRQTATSEAESENMTKSSGTTLSRTEGNGLADAPGGLTRTANQSAALAHNSAVSEGAGRSVAHSFAEGESSSLTRGRTNGRTDTQSDGGSVVRSQGQNWSDGTNWSAAKGVAEGENWTQGTSQAQQQNWTQGTSDTVSKAKTASRTRGTTLGEALALAFTKGRSHGVSDGTSVGHTHGTADAAGASVSFGVTQTPLARHKLVEEETGRLKTAIPDQLARIANLIASLADRTLLVKCKGFPVPFLMKVHDVAPPKPADVEGFLRRMRAAHPCFFDPRQVRKAPPAPAPRPLVNDDSNPIA